MHSVPVVDHVLIVCHNTLYMMYEIAVTAEHNVIKYGINNNDDVIAFYTYTTQIIRFA